MPDNLDATTVGRLFAEIGEVHKRLDGVKDSLNEVNVAQARLETLMAAHVGSPALHRELPERPCKDFKEHVGEHTKAKDEAAKESKDERMGVRMLLYGTIFSALVAAISAVASWAAKFMHFGGSGQ